MGRWFGLGVSVLLIAACGGSDADEATAESVAVAEPAQTQVVDTDDVETTEPAATEPAATEPAVISPWTEIVPDAPDCACSDGSEFRFFERPGDPTKVMFYFEGGGACFNLETCDPSGSPTYTTDISQTVDGLAGRTGLFDADNPENPVADHSIVYVPYCTGDVHIGNTTTEYSPEVVIEHRGAANANAALAYLAERYPDAEQVLVTGASAGSVPTPLVAGLVSDALPDAEVITLGDSSGAYPDVPAVNELIGSLWGTENAIPDWPENEGIALADWSFPNLYVQAGLHAPDITFARFDYAFDDVQASFAALAGVGADEVVRQIDATEAQVEAGGVPLAVFVAPGTEHTIIGGDEVYDMEVEGVRLIDWITELVGGEVPADVHCVECTG